MYSRVSTEIRVSSRNNFKEGVGGGGGGGGGQMLLLKIRWGRVTTGGGGGGLGAMDFFHTRMLLHGGDKTQARRDKFPPHLNETLELKALLHTSKLMLF